MAEVRKTRLGGHVSAAVPKLWAVLKTNKWSQGDLARELDTTSSVVNRWLHGDQKPSRRFSKAIEQRWGVSQNDWDVAPRKPFELQSTDEAKSA
jgi:transcriptional regulator with XRE-family HTH domain